MKRKFFLPIFIFSFLATFLFLRTAVVLADSPGFIATSDSPPVNGGADGSTEDVNAVKEKLMRFKSFLQDPEGNLFQWVGGRIIGQGEAEIFQEHGFLGSIEYGLLTQLAGSPEEPLSKTNSGQTLPMGAIIMPPGDWYFSGGMVGATNNLIAATFSSPPASGVYYAYDVLDNLGVAPAYAQGIAFGGHGETLRPILGLWKGFRDVTYSLFAIVFIIVGLMVMFRVRTSPQTVLTIETALPRVIGILVLITFSYALAGFMIDLMYVVMGLVANIIRSNDPSIWQGQNTADIIRHGFPDILFYQSLGKPMILSTALGTIIGGAIGLVGGLPGAAIGAPVGAILTLLIFLLIIIYIIFKLFIALVKTYINLLLLIIFSPLYIMAGVFPGSSLGFASWLKQLMANLLVFPAVFLMVALSSSISLSSSGLWSPPVMVGGITASFLSALIGFGFLLILPSVPDIVRGAMGIKDTGMGGMAMAPVAAVTGATVGRVAGNVMGGADKYMSEVAGTIVKNKVEGSPKAVGLLNKFGWQKPKPPEIGPSYTSGKGWKT